MNHALESGLKTLGLTPPHHALEQMETYAHLLLEKNKVMNLTAITQPDQVVGLHFLDSAALLGCHDFTQKAVIDVGTGAGFPGMVLKLMEPSLTLTLADSLSKRLDWLEEVANQLFLSSVSTLHCRAEELCHHPNHREHYDIATARAVSELSILCELCLPLVKLGGTFLAMKGADYEKEWEQAKQAIQILGGEVTQIYPYQIPHLEIDRWVIVVKKNHPTPEQYPRRWAKMQKSPL